MKTKVFALFLALVLLLSCSMVSVFAELNYDKVVPGVVTIITKPGVDEVSAESFPEIEIDTIDAHALRDKTTLVYVSLVEKTGKAAVEAVELLKDNPIIASAYYSGAVVDDEATVPTKKPGDFESGKLCVGIEADKYTAPINELLPEIEIAAYREIKYPDTVTVFIDLAENTEKAVLDGIELLKNNQNIIYAEPCYYQFLASAPGDVNGDGVVSNGDIVQLSRFLVGATQLMSSISNADVNGDGKVSNADLVILAQKVVA